MTLEHLKLCVCPLVAAGLVINMAGAQSAPARPDAQTQFFGLPDKHSPEAVWWSESVKTRDDRIRWWREARFGMFVHWGMSMTRKPGRPEIRSMRAWAIRCSLGRCGQGSLK